MIRVKNLTKEYVKNKGVFDISFEVQKGEVLGCLGPSGAGKTTIIRQLMGFEEPSGGQCFIKGRSCYAKSNELHYITGYVPQVEALPKHETGFTFLRFMAEMRGMRSMERAMILAEYLNVDLMMSVRKMTEENRQCISIINAFMNNPAVLLLDEPTNRLGALQKHHLSVLIQEEKVKGRTIFVTSPKFSEIEHLCDRMIMLRKGDLFKTDDIAGIRSIKQMEYVITFSKESEAQAFTKEQFKVTEVIGRQVTVKVTGEMTLLVSKLGSYQVVGIEAVQQSLDAVFEYDYGEQRND